MNCSDVYSSKRVIPKMSVAVFEIMHVSVMGSVPPPPPPGGGAIANGERVLLGLCMVAVVCMTMYATQVEHPAFA